MRGLLESCLGTLQGAWSPGVAGDDRGGRREAPPTPVIARSPGGATWQSHGSPTNQWSPCACGEGMIRAPPRRSPRFTARPEGEALPTGVPPAGRSPPRSAPRDDGRGSGLLAMTGGGPLLATTRGGHAPRDDSGGCARHDDGESDRGGPPFTDIPHYSAVPLPHPPRLPPYRSLTENQPRSWGKVRTGGN